MLIRPLQYCTVGTKSMLVKVLVLTLCLMPIFTAQRVIAHHSMDRFDAKNVTTVEGLVKKVEWGNPHVYIYIDQLSDNGNLIEWEVEGFPPAIMRRLGWSRDTLRVNDAIAITGNQHKNAEIKSIYPTSIKRADSSLLNMLAMMMTINKVGEEPEFGTKSIEGIWVTLLSLELIHTIRDHPYCI